MKLEGRIYCEGPDCEVHQRIGVPNMHAGRLPVGWLRVVEYGDAGPHESAYHNWDCLMRRAAEFEPPTVIPVDDGELPPFLDGGST